MNPPDFSDWLNSAPFSMGAAEKSKQLTGALDALTQWHASRCPEYARVLDVLGYGQRAYYRIEDIPFIPVRLFKEFELLSIERDQVFKTMTSSGTTGQQVSRIFLDRETAAFQTKVLTSLIGHTMGKKRLPMLIIDSPGVLRNRTTFSARGAGILGFSMFGLDVTYALDDQMALNIAAIESFLDRHAGKTIFLFGFTYMIWQHFVLPLRERQIQLAIPDGVLLHGGGWKKLQDQAVDNSAFRTSLREVTQIKRVINYYGMVEQTGSIYLECETGHLHASIYSDVIVRNPIDFSPAAMGEEGVIEVVSIVPRSYPGHALLTEDVGTVLGEDNCPCGRLGRYFKVAGRLAQAEVRGCSDTYETRS